MNKKGIYYPLLIWAVLFFLLIGVMMWDIDRQRQEKHDKAPEICNKLGLEFLTIEKGFNDYVVCFNNETKQTERIKIW